MYYKTHPFIAAFTIRKKPKTYIPENILFPYDFLVLLLNIFICLEGTLIVFLCKVLLRKLLLWMEAAIKTDSLHRTSSCNPPAVSACLSLCQMCSTWRAELRCAQMLTGTTRSPDTSTSALWWCRTTTYLYRWGLNDPHRPHGSCSIDLISPQCSRVNAACWDILHGNLIANMICLITCLYIYIWDF